MDISSSDGLFSFLLKIVFSNFQSKALQVQPKILCPTVRGQILQTRSWISMCGIATHPVLPPCIRAFSATVDKHRCLHNFTTLLKLLLSPHLLPLPKRSTPGLWSVCASTTAALGLAWFIWASSERGTGDPALAGACAKAGCWWRQHLWPSQGFPTLTCCELCGDSGRCLCDVLSPRDECQWRQCS